MKKFNYNNIEIVQENNVFGCTGCIFNGEYLKCYNFMRMHDIDMCINTKKIFVKYDPVKHMTEEQKEIIKPEYYEQGNLF